MESDDSYDEDEHKDEIDESESEVDSTLYHDVYVYPCFLKPGKQMFLVGTSDNDFFLHKFMAA